MAEEAWQEPTGAENCQEDTRSRDSKWGKTNGVCFIKQSLTY